MWKVRSRATSVRVMASTGVPEHHDDGGGVVGPDEEREAGPGHARGAHAVDGDDEVEAGEDGGEAGDEDADGGQGDVGIQVAGGERGGEGPAGIDAAEHQRGEGDAEAEHVQVPAEQIDFGEGEILGADHEGHEEVAQGRGDRRHQEEEDHDDAVGGEELVIGIGLEHVAGGREQLQADADGQQTAEQEREGDRDADRAWRSACGRRSTATISGCNRR